MSEVKKIFPQQLIPPPEVLKKIMEKEKNKLPRNKFMRLIVLFFGEGF